MIQIELSNNKIVGVYRINYNGKKRLLALQRDYVVVDYNKKQEQRQYKCKYLNETFYI